MYRVWPAGYYVYRSNKPDQMKKATLRPTVATRQAAQAKADRRAAALERRQDDYRQDAGYQAIYTKAVGA